MLHALHRHSKDPTSVAAASWDILKVGTPAALAAALEAAVALEIEPPEVAELSLADLAILLPTVQPLLLLRLRQLARGNASKAPMDIAGTKVQPPTGLRGRRGSLARSLHKTLAGWVTIVSPSGLR